MTIKIKVVPRLEENIKYIASIQSTKTANRPLSAVIEFAISKTIKLTSFEWEPYKIKLNKASFKGVKPTNIYVSPEIYRNILEVERKMELAFDNVLSIGEVVDMIIEAAKDVLEAEGETMDFPEKVVEELLRNDIKFSEKLGTEFICKPTYCFSKPRKDGSVTVICQQPSNDGYKYAKIEITPQIIENNGFTHEEIEYILQDIHPYNPGCFNK